MSQTPQTPTYAKAIPKQGCSGNGFNTIYIPSWAQQIKDVEVSSNDPQVIVTDNSNSQKHSFSIDFIPQQAVSGTLNMILEESNVVVSNPVLKGKTIDEVQLSWSLNKTIASQSLESGETDPSLLSTDRNYTYTGLSITGNSPFTLSVDDGKGLEGSTLDLVQTVEFGNYLYYGHGSTKIGSATSGIQAFLDALNKSIKVNKLNSLFATGGEDEHFFFAYPKSFGLPTDIKKGVFSGGYIRLLNVGGTLKTSLGQGESESDLTISNGLVSEAYYLYMSAVDNQNDPNISIDIL